MISWGALGMREVWSRSIAAQSRGDGICHAGSEAFEAPMEGIAIDCGIVIMTTKPRAT